MGKPKRYLKEDLAWYTSLSRCHLMEPILVMRKDMRKVARVARSKEQGKVLK